MKLYYFKSEGLEVYLEDDGKGKDTSVDGHIHMHKYVYGWNKSDLKASMIRELDTAIKDLSLAKAKLEGE
jgi:hypothetical protein